MSTLAAVPLDANLILGGYLILATVGLVFGYYTVRGSGINKHPCDGRDGAPGAKLPDEFTQFKDWQIHEADLREAEIERRVEARMARTPDDQWEPPWLERHVPLPRRRAAEPDISLDEANRRLAAEAAVRKELTAEDWTEVR
jgi:hypothetical protein